MRRFKTIFVVVMFWFLSRPFAFAQQPDFDKFKKALARVEVKKQYVGQGQRRGDNFGTGFIISVEGDTAYVLTAGHLFRPDTNEADFDPKPEVYWFLDRFTMRKTQILADFSRMYDLMVLEVDIKGLPLADIPKFSLRPQSDPIKSAEDVSVFAQLAATETPVVKTSVVDLSNQQKVTSFLYKPETIREGFSGGPVLDKNGNLVGVHLNVIDGRRAGEAIHATDVSRILRSAGTKMSNVVGEGLPDSVPLTQQIGRAVVANDHAAMERILKDPGITQRLKNDALIGARSEAMATLLLSSGADPAAHDEYDNSPLCVAVENHRTSVVRVLVKTRKVDPNELCNSRPSSKRSPLQIVAYNWITKGDRWTDIIQLLAQLPNLDPNIKDPQIGSQMAAFSLMDSDTDFVEQLVRLPKFNVNAINDRGRTLADNACLYRHRALLKEILDRGGKGKSYSDKELKRCVEKGTP